MLNSISDDVVSIIKSQGDEIDRLMVSQGTLFVDSIVEQLEDNQKKLEVMIKDKQESINKLEEFFTVITKSKKILLELGE